MYFVVRLTFESDIGLDKAFYQESNNESIENFITDFEGYAAMKDWDEDKMRLVISLYVAELLRNWIRDIVGAKKTWTKVKNTILISAKAKYDTEAKIECLMNLNNCEKKHWYLRGLPEKYRNKIKKRYPETYKETRDWVIKVEKFEKSEYWCWI
ncbi:21630_t:CDS:2, partial [Racocetra persica]